MGTIFSTVSGQFGKAWILGALLPAAIFVVLALLLVQPMLPVAWQVIEPAAAFDPAGVLALSFAVLFISGLLFQLNNPIIRFYEGYPWQEGAIGRARTAFYRDRFDEDAARWRGMRTLLRAMPDKTGEDYAEIRRWRNRIGLRHHLQFPAEREHILPTRLGNVIRGFEEYPRIAYGIDAIALWPHLVQAMEKDRAAAIEDEKIGFDFMLNTSLLLALLAAATLYAGLADPFPFGSWAGLPVRWGAQLLLFAALAYLFYLWAIGRAQSWGATVRAAFETNRWAMLRQLGYLEGPVTREAERALWTYVSQQILRGETPRGAAADYVVRTFADGVPSGVDLEVSRGVAVVDAEKRRTIAIDVRNADARKAEGVTITDLVPDDADYLVGSAECSGGGVRVSGTNPYRFDVGALEPGAERRLTYRVAPRG